MRSVGLLTIALLCAAPPSLGADDDFDKKARTKPIAIHEMPLHMYALPRGKEVSEAATAVTTKIANKNIVFVDVDANGKYDDAGVDGWVVNAKGRNYIVPMEEWIVVKGRRIWLRFDEDGKQVLYREEKPVWPSRLPRLKGKGAGIELRQTKKDVSKGLLVWNDLRLRNGLPPLYLDEELTFGCIMHARYMSRHGLGHDEDPELGGFTEEGRTAGKSGSVGSLSSAQEIYGAYSTLYHRISLFHPYTRGGGVGDARSFSCFNGTESRAKRRWQWPVAVPADGCEDVLLTYAGERPVPHPYLRKRGVFTGGGGFPITLTFERPEVTDVTAELRKDGPEGAAIPFALSSPEKPANETVPTNYKTICLMPHARLKPRTTYWVHATWKYRKKPGERTWSFKTGR